MIMQQQQQPGTVTNSHISSLLIFRCLTRYGALRYSVRTSNCFRQLTSQLPVSSDNNYAYHECIHVTRSGVATQNLSGVFHAPMAELPLLNF